MQKYKHEIETMNMEELRIFMQKAYLADFNSDDLRTLNRWADLRLAILTDKVSIMAISSETIMGDFDE